jgi:hypothetical protein
MATPAGDNDSIQNGSALKRLETYKVQLENYQENNESLINPNELQRNYDFKKL